MRDDLPELRDELAARGDGIKALYINRDKDDHRRHLIELELARVGMSGTRLRAIEGVDVPPDLAGYFAHADGRRAPLVSAGAIGCYGSHLKAYKQIVTQQIEVSLVLEDDAILDNRLPEILRETVAVLPSGWDMVHLSSPPRHAVKPLVGLPCGRTLVRYSRIPFGTGGYLISKAGAIKMLNPAIKRIWAIDLDTRRPWLFGIDAYGLIAPPIRQNREIASTIYVKGAPRSARRGLPRPTAYSWTNTPLRTPASFLFNVRKLGPAWWFGCFAVNCVLKLRASLRPLVRVTAGYSRRARLMWR